MKITRRLLALLLAFCLTFGNVMPAMATEIADEEIVTEETVAPVEETQESVEEPAEEPADEAPAQEMSTPTTPEEIVDAAWALAEGETLEGTYTLTGKIIAVDTAYSEQYENITVTIAVAGRESKPIKCYRLKGDGAADLEKGDTITVTGTLKNYYGTIEFDQGCTLDAVVKAEPEVTEPGDAPIATMTFDAANRMSWDTEHQQWKSNGITLTNTKGASTSNVADYTGTARFYKNSTMKIEYPGMSKVVFVCNGSKYILAASDVAALGTAAVDGFDVTLTLNNAADSIEFVLASNQVRLDKIEIYGTGVAVNPEEPEVTEPAPTEPAPTEPEVTEPAPSEPGVDVEPANAAISFADGSLRTAYSAEQQVWQNGDLVFTNNKANSTSDIYDIVAKGYGEVRLYQGSEVVVAYPGMTKIVFSVDDYKDTYVSALTDSIANLGTVIVDGLVVTLELTDVVDSISYSAAAQHRLTDIAVYGTGVAVNPEEPEVTEPAPTEPEVTEPAPTEPEVTEPALGTEENPIAVEFVMNDDYTAGDATVTVPANTTYYFYAFGIGGMELTINGGEPTLLSGNPRMPVVFSVTNSTDAEAEFLLHISHPVGSWMNPAALLVNELGEPAVLNVVELAADDFDGYMYNWTAPMSGELTISMENTVAGWAYSITNLMTYAQTEMHFSCDVPVVKSETVVVNAGDVIQLSVNSCGADANTIPGGTVAFTAEFVEYVGTEENPLELDNLLVWNEEYTEATATIVVPAHTVYWIHTWLSGKQLTCYVNGETYGPTLLEDPEYDGIMLTMDNNSDEEWVYTLVISIPPAPVGSWDNPAELVIGENSCEIEEGSWSGYLYQWVAPFSGELTITMGENVPSWSYQINNLTSYVYGDMYDIYSGVASQTITVETGDVIQVNVDTAADPDTWQKPAGTVTFTAEYAPNMGAETNPEMLDLGEIEMSGAVHRWNWLNPGGNYHYVFYSFAEMSLGVWGEEGMTVTVNGVDYELNYSYQEILIPASRMGNTISFTNTTEDRMLNYEFHLEYPLGSMNNPHYMNLGVNSVKLPANNNGYYFRYWANESGIMTLTMQTEKNWSYTVMKESWQWDEETGSQLVMSYVSDIQTYGEGGSKTHTIEVQAGDRVYMVVGTKDRKAGTIKFNATLASKDYEVKSGASKVLTFNNPANGKKIDATKANWEVVGIHRLEIRGFETWFHYVDPDEVDYSTIATVGNSGKNAGKFTAKAGAECGYVVDVVASLKSNPEVMNHFQITITVPATEVQIVRREWTENGHIDSENLAGTTIDFYPNQDWIQLTAVVNPEGATKSVTWKSSNTKILTVNEYGTLEPVWNSKTHKYNSGTVTVTATAADGSGKSASVKVNVAWLADWINVYPKNGQWQLASGKSLNMIAEVDDWATNKAVSWSLSVGYFEEDWMTGETYWVDLDIDPATVATINDKGVLTAAKGLTEYYNVKVIATSKDIGAAEGFNVISITPAATEIVIEAPAEYDLTGGQELFIPAAAISDGFRTLDLKWTISDKKIVSEVVPTYSYDPETWEEIAGANIVFTGKTGKVTLTAATTDGTNLKKSVTIKVVEAPTELKLSKNEALLAAGKSLTLNATVGPKSATDKTFGWSVEYFMFNLATGEETVLTAAEIGAKFSKGTMSVDAKKFNKFYDAQEGNVVVYANVTATANKSYTATYWDDELWADVTKEERASDSCEIQFVPATTKVDIRLRGEVITGKTLKIDNDGMLVLHAGRTPVNPVVFNMLQWTSSNQKIATVVKNVDGSVSVVPTGKTGTVTITATAQDGSKKAASVKVKIVNKVDELTIDTSKFVLTGTKKGRSFDLNKLLTVNPSDATDKSVTWSISEMSKADAAANKITLSANGKLTAKKDVEAPVTLYVTVKANDGFGAATGAMITITPATKSVNIVDQDGIEIVDTQEVAIDGELKLNAISDPELAAGLYNWKSSNTKVAKVVINEDGTVSVVGVKTGTAKITATAADGSGKTDTITVKVVEKKN